MSYYPMPTEEIFVFSQRSGIVSSFISMHNGKVLNNIGAFFYLLVK